MIRVCGSVLLIAVASLAQTPDERTLARNGLKPTRESLGQFLRSMAPDPQAQALIEEYISDLGAAQATRRELAMRELMRMRVASIAALERAVDDDEPEVRRRARALLDHARQRLPEEVLYCVLRTIHTRKITGLAAEVLGTLPLAGDPYLRRAAHTALAATARPADLPLLMRAATEGATETRLASFAAIGNLRGKQAAPFLRGALKSPSGRVRYTAAHELANLNERAALPVLVELLDSPDEWVRFRAVSSLRSVAGNAFGYSAPASQKSRIAATQRWRDWHAAHGATARWKTPLRIHARAVGRTLVAVYSKHRVIEFDDRGNVTWTLDKIKNPWAVRGLPDGHRLITRFSENIVTEYDANGKRIWQSAKLPGNVTSVDRLSNGNILVALGSNQNRIAEIGRDSKQIWSLEFDGQPVCARQLPGDRLLVTLQKTGRVIEIDRTGRVLWELNGLKMPYNATRMPNGNVLVATFGGKRVSEFDRDGKLVWEKTGVANLYTAARLPDGSTIYGDNTGLHRLDAKGKQVWHHEVANDYLFIDRY